MSTKLVLTAKGADATKTVTVSNPVDKTAFDSDDVDAMFGKLNAVYDTDYAFAKAVYVTTTEEQVYPV